LVRTPENRKSKLLNECTQKVEMTGTSNKLTQKTVLVVVAGKIEALDISW
jgi:hypothetical protein